MKWFDTQEIKGREGMGEEQVRYLTSPSVTLFGPLNIIVRKHWDILLVIVGVSLLGNGIAATLPRASLGFMERLGQIASEPVTLIASLVQLGVYAWIIYFGVKHGRRLAWNRSEWKDFSAFQTSETRWKPWGWAVVALGIVTFLMGLFI